MSDPIDPIRPEYTTLAGGGGRGGDEPPPRPPPRRADPPEDVVALSPDAQRAVADAALPPLLPLGWIVRLARWIRSLWPPQPPQPEEAAEPQAGAPAVDPAPAPSAPPPRLPRQSEVRRRDRRQHERVPSKGCTVRIDSQVYEILDVSLGGFTFGPDCDLLIPNQRFYFELRFHGDPPAPPVRADGMVVRVTGGTVAAKFFLPLTTTQRLIAEFVSRNMD